jgi:enoyl-CoA hydratase/carnithine racemase
MIRGTEMNLEEGLMLESRLMDVVVASEDHKEARDAWLEKRKPDLKGR